MRTITREVAHRLAIRILQYKYPRRGIELKPEAIQEKSKKLIEQFNLDIDPSAVTNFFSKWILPQIVIACGLSKDSTTTSNPNDDTISSVEGMIAVRFLSNEHISPIDIGSTLDNLSKHTGIVQSELHALYWQFVFPAQLGRQYQKHDCLEIAEIIHESVKIRFDEVKL